MRLTGAECNVREIEQARPVINLVIFRSSWPSLFLRHGGERVSFGKGNGGSPIREGKLSRVITQLIKGAGGRVKRASVLISGDDVVRPQI